MTRVDRLMGFVEQDPSNTELLCDFLDELLVAGRVDNVAHWVSRADRAARDSVAVRFRLARASLMQGDLARADGMLRQLIAEGADAPGIRHDLAFVQLCAGHYDEAGVTLEGVQGAGDDAVAIALLKGRILHRQKKFEKALEVLGAIPDTARQGEAKGLRALILLDLGDAAQANSLALEALSIDPDQYEAAIVAGTVALWDGRMQAALETFRHTLSRAPDSGRVLSGLGQVLMAGGDIAHARSVLEHATRSMPDHIGTWHALAWCQLLEGDVQAARKSFDEAFAIDRAFGETHGGFALIHALRGERLAAEESIKKATRLDAGGRSARYARSVLLLDGGKDAEAQAVVTGIVSEFNGRPVVVSIEFLQTLRERVRGRS